MKRFAQTLSLLFLLLLSCAACGGRTEEEAPPPEADIETEAPDASGGEEPEDMDTEDHVLLTLEAPLAGGRTLTLEAVGKVTDEYNTGVREVRVYDGEKLLQTILSREAIEDFWGSSDGGMTPDYTSCWNPEDCMEAVDLNFDGNTDFGLFGWPANNTIPFYYWLWDAGAGQYRYAFTLQGAKAHPETGEVVSEYKSGSAGAEYAYDYYRPDEDGNLILARRELSIYSNVMENQDMERPVWETWVPREGVAARLGEWYESDLVLTRREIPVYETDGSGAITYYTEIWELPDEESQESQELQLVSREEFSYET